MNSFKLYGIYIAQFPFLDAGEGKIRPVIAVSYPHGRHNAIAIVPVSSTSKRENVDTALNDWNDEGLIRPSVARVHRISTILQSDLLSELGELTAEDIEDLRISMRDFLSL